MSMDITSRTKRDQLSQELRSWIEDIEKSKETIDNVALELYKNYNSIRSKRWYNGDSDVFVPMSFMMVETMVAKLMSRIFGEEIPVPLSGLGPSDKDKEKRVRALLHSQQKSQVNLKLKMMDYLRAKCIFPRAYARVSWRTDYRKVKRTFVENQTQEQPQEPQLQPGLDGLDQFGIPPEAEQAEGESGAITEGGIPAPSFVKVGVEEVNVAEYDCWDFQNLDFFDMGVDPMAPDGDIQRAKVVYHRTLVTDADLKVMADMKDGDGNNIYQMTKADIDGSGDGEFLEDIIDKKEMIGLDIRNLDSLKNVGDMHELHEIYYDYDIDNDGVVERSCLFYLLDRTVIIRAEKNPWWHGKKPFVSGSFFRRPNEFMGQSLIQPVRKIQYEINDKRNQELDATTYTLSPMWFAGDDANIEDSALRWTTGGVIRVGDINQIKPTIVPDMTSVGQRAEAILEANMREALGITRSTQGLAENGPRQSATQFSQLLAQAGERVQLMLETFAVEEWRDMWGMAHSLNQQFLKEATAVRLTERETMGFELGAEGEIGPADIAINMDFTVNTFQDIATKNAKSASIMQFAELTSKFPPSEGNQGFFNIIIRKLWVDVLGFGEEELIDDAGNPILLTQPGAASIFDTEITQPGQGQQPSLQPESPAQVEQGGINDGDLAALENAIQGGT